MKWWNEGRRQCEQLSLTGHACTKLKHNGKKHIRVCMEMGVNIHIYIDYIALLSARLFLILAMNNRSDIAFKWIDSKMHMYMWSISSGTDFF